VSRNALRVVIAEDEALIRLDLKEMLEEEGYSVIAEAGDGEAAVESVTSLRPDLAIFDVKMPVLDGISAAERIAADRIAPIVILTAFSQRELVERARDAAICSAAEIPSSTGIFTSKIARSGRRLITRSTAASPSPASATTE